MYINVKHHLEFFPIRPHPPPPKSIYKASELQRSTQSADKI